MTREKYMPVKRRQNLAKTGRGSHYKEEWLKELLDSKGAFYNGNEGYNDHENYNEIMDNSSHCRVLPKFVTK